MKGNIRNVNTIRKNFLQCNEGITLVALVVTIVVLLILAGVSINIVLGENGLIAKAQEASFRTEMATIEETVEMKKLECEMAGITITDNLEVVPITESNNWKAELNYEIITWGSYDLGTNKIDKNYVQKQYASIYSNKSTDGINIPNLYYLSEEIAGTGKGKKYVYDARINQVYKIAQTKIGKYKVHSIAELEYQRKGATGEKETSAGTLISIESNIKQVGNTAHYEPDLTGFIMEKTSIIYYNGTAQLEIGALEYIQNKTDGIETRTKGDYTFYDYENKKWANIKVLNDEVETWWVWIPRYCYKIGEADQPIDIVFVDIENKDKDGLIVAKKNDEDIVDPKYDGYVLHSAFDDNKKGIWISKYEPSLVQNIKSTEMAYYTPDLTGFVRENTYIEIYDKANNRFNEVPLTEINDLKAFGQKNNWYDYDNQVWANIKVVNDGIETWWVWIPRYAYSITGSSENSTTNIKFIDTSNIPLDGTNLDSNYIVHPAFNNNKKGIWVSKYEASLTKNNVANSNVNKPDLTNFDINNTYIEVYDKKNNKFVETKLANISNIDEFIRNNNWYNYSNQEWANIKVVNNNVETWWVWIPSYAYNIVGSANENEANIIFLNESGNPIDGSSLPANYIIHPAFAGKTGIWVSKYEPSNVE